MVDGLYRVVTNTFVAGFVVEDGRVTQCAPILRGNLDHWKQSATLCQQPNGT